ncbi:MAG: hypothetical protein WCF57_13320 [Pyrinomonadaceae bacterium]
MKRTILSVVLIFAGAILTTVTASTVAAYAATKNVAEEHGFGVKEYDEFHHVLRPLQHEALPAKDFKRIRSRAGLLVALGEAIVKLGVPRGVEEKAAPQFGERLKRFNEALAKFKTDAVSGTDEQLKVSYLVVHDSFETLAEMLPKG